MAELTEKIDIKSMLPEELAEYLRSLGQPAYRAKQLFRWFSAGCGSWDEMTNLPRALRQELSEHCTLSAPRVLKKQQSAEDGTIKFLWELHDGNAVETVVMRYHYGNTVCISSQVGCRQGCAFCASTIGGLVRNLTPSEMLDEVLFSEKESGLPVSHIVLMGIGEPLDNFDTVMRFLELINHPAYIALHLWADGALRRSGGARSPDHAFRIAARAGRRNAQPHYAGQPRPRRGRAFPQMQSLL